MSVLYHASDWIAPNAFIYTRAENRALNPELHSHDFYEIVYLASGNISHQINSTVRAMLPGDIVILRPGDSHLPVCKGTEYELYSISVTTSEMELFLSTYSLSDVIHRNTGAVVFSIGTNIFPIVNLFHRLAHLSEKEQEAHLRIIIGMTIHEFLLVQSSNLQSGISSILQQMNIPENLAEGVPAMQRLLNLSHSQLCRVVKRHTNLTPQQYIKELRMIYAYDLIQNTAEPFDDIAYSVGYSSFSHFSTTFKQRFGITPSMLRKRHISLL